MHPSRLASPNRGSARLALDLLGVLGLLAGVLPAQVPARQEPREATHGFLPNRGQWNDPSRFQTAKGPMHAWFLADGWWFTLQRPVLTDRGVPGVGAPDPRGLAAGGREALAVRMRFVGAHAARIEGVEERPGRHHFFLGSDPARWRSDVPAYHRLRYTGLYPGIDLSVRDSRHLFGFDCLLAPGADVRQIVVEVEGVERLSVATDGSLLLHTAFGPVVQSAPVAWHEMDSGERPAVACSYRLIGSHRFGFVATPARDDAPLVIDPDLRWSTFLGGSQRESGFGLARVSENRLVVAGPTDSPNFPLVPGPFFGPLGMRDAFVSCLDESVAGPGQLVWSTRIGGGNDEFAFGVAADPTGQVTVVGCTESIDFPATPGAFRGVQQGGVDAFVAALSPGGNALIYATYLGGTGDEWACAVRVGPGPVPTVAGFTGSASFPTTGNAFQTRIAGGRDAFVTRLDPAGASLLYSTFLGGSGDEGVMGQNWKSAPMNIRTLGLDVDAAGRVLVAGITASSGFPTTPGAFARIHQGQRDAFVSLLNPAQPPVNQLVWSTYLGNQGDDGAMAAAFVAPQRVVAGGYTYSPLFPTTLGAYSRVLKGGDDAFVTLFDLTRTDQAQLQYSTLVGGSGADALHALAVDSLGHATAAGFCSDGLPGARFPVTPRAFQTGFGGVQDGWVARLRMANLGPSDLVHATYLGGTENDAANAVVLDGAGGAWIAGGTQSANFPMRGTPYQSTHGGSADAWVGHLDLLPSNVMRLPASHRACGDSFVLDLAPDPIAGNAFDLFGRGHALLVGLRNGSPAPFTALGATFWVGAGAGDLILPWQDRGSLTIPTSPAMSGLTIHFQTAVLVPGCGTSLFSTAALRVTL